MALNGWKTVLEAAANTCAGEDGCCQCFDDETAECCMTDQARKVFEAIEAAGGPSLEQIEDIAANKLSNNT